MQNYLQNSEVFNLKSHNQVKSIHVEKHIKKKLLNIQGLRKFTTQGIAAKKKTT